jgi:hypothetical protein
MITPSDKRPCADLLLLYQNLVNAIHPSKVASWPLLTGWNIIQASFKDWAVVVLKDAGFAQVTMMNGVGELSEELVGAAEITSQTRDAVRSRLERHFNIGKRDAVVLYSPDDNISPEIEAMFRRHEFALGLTPMKIFLSHKGADKPMVREFKKTLELLGFDPWLDEDSMHAGTELERGILDGFDKSCAAVFFITENFRDEQYIATEVNYAISEKRKKGERFSIITLVFGDSVGKANIPGLLHHYVWKEPSGHLAALREIILALPVQVGDVYWKT